METLGRLEGVVDFHDEGPLLLGSHVLGDGTFLRWLCCLAVQIVKQCGAVRQGEEDAALMQHFVTICAVFFLFAAGHRLGAIDDLVLGSALRRHDEGGLALEVSLARVVLRADCGVDCIFFILLILYRDVLGHLLADNRLKVKLQVVVSFLLERLTH